MNEAPVTFRSAGAQIVGMLHRPGGRGRHPAVVMLHGFTGNSIEAHRLFVEAARHLSGQGFVVLRFDFRGAGNSAGSFADLTISSQIADARAALRWLGRQPGVDAQRVGLIGLSMGGLVATHVLAKDRRVRAAVLWNPLAWPRALRDERMNPALWVQLKQCGVGDWGGWPVSMALHKELGRFDPIPVLPLARCPVRLIQAAEDQTTPMAGAMAMQRAMKKAGRPLDFQVVPGADHTFNRFDWTASALALTSTWLKQHLA